MISEAILLANTFKTKMEKLCMPPDAKKAYAYFRKTHTQADR